MKNKTTHLYGIDVFRGLAVAMMFVTHISKLYIELQTDFFQHFKESVFDRAIVFFLEIEPLISGMFLFLVGFSLILSLKSAASPSDWSRKAFGRVWKYYLMSLALFFVEYGIQIPDFFFSSGILSIIALSIAVVVLLKKFPFQNYSYNLALGLIFFSVIGYFGENGAKFSGLNVGPGAGVPLVHFSLLGALVGLLFFEFQNQGMALLGLLSVSFFIMLMSNTKDPWILDFSSVYQVFPNGGSGVELIKSFFTQAQSTDHEEWFWNHSLIAVVRIFCVIGVAVSLLIRFGDKMKSLKIFYPLTTLGNRALFCYITHLAVIAVLKELHFGPRSGLACWITVLIFIACGVGLSEGVNRIRHKTR